MSKYVAIEIEGELTIHAQDCSGNHATLCGVDGDDPKKSVQQRDVPLPKGRKINCPQCRNILRVAWGYKPSDLEI